MIDSTAVLGVAAIALGLVLTPGPNMVYLVSRSITQGRAAGLVSLAGVALGFLCYLAAATLGISAVFSAVPQAYTALKLAGACYLGWLAWKALRPGGHTPFAPSRALPRDSSARLFLMGFTTNLLNPKIIGVSAKIHPVMVVFSLLVGEHFFGLWGALLAVPVFSITQSLFNHFRFESLDDAGPDSLSAEELLHRTRSAHPPIE